MTRLLTWLVAVVVLVGCTGSGATTLLDPFSRTRVEPPRTGCIMGQPADPYYPGTRQAALPESASPRSGLKTNTPGTSPPGTTPGTGNRNDPPGGYAYQGTPAKMTGAPPAADPGDRVLIPPAARNALDQPDTWARPEQSVAVGRAAKSVDRSSGPVAATSSAVATAGGTTSAPDRTAAQLSTPSPPSTASLLAGRERIVRTIQPGSTSDAMPVQASSAGAVSPSREPRQLVVPRQAVDIMDLPPAGSTSGGRSSHETSTGAIRLVSATQVVDNASTGSSGVGGVSYRTMGGAEPSSFSPRTRYGHDPEYRWLRGRLEHSEIERRWKLRYIPIDGDTDQFGGSVVLSDPSLLSGYERGQFVEVHGSLGPVPQDEDRGYAPEFEIERIERAGG